MPGSARRIGVPWSRVSSILAWISTPGMSPPGAKGVGNTSCRMVEVAPTSTIFPAKVSGGSSPETARWYGTAAKVRGPPLKLISTGVLRGSLAAATPAFCARR